MDPKCSICGSKMSGGLFNMIQWKCPGCDCFYCGHCLKKAGKTGILLIRPTCPRCSRKLVSG